MKSVTIKKPLKSLSNSFSNTLYNHSTTYSSFSNEVNSVMVEGLSSGKQRRFCSSTDTVHEPKRISSSRFTMTEYSPAWLASRFSFEASVILPLSND